MWTCNGGGTLSCLSHSASVDSLVGLPPPSFRLLLPPPPPPPPPPPMCGLFPLSSVFWSSLFLISSRWVFLFFFFFIFLSLSFSCSLRSHVRSPLCGTSYLPKFFNFFYLVGSYIPFTRKSPRRRDLAEKEALSARRLSFCGWWKYNKLDFDFAVGI